MTVVEIALLILEDDMRTTIVEAEVQVGARATRKRRSGRDGEGVSDGEVVLSAEMMSDGLGQWWVRFILLHDGTYPHPLVW